MDTNTIFLFPPLRLDVRSEQLWHGAQALALRPKTLAVLRLLVAQAGQLITQDALRAAVWSLAVVSEMVIYQQALTLAEELGMRLLQVHCHRGLGTL